MRQPMLFSAAYSEQLERTRQESQQQAYARPQVLWRRGFHSEGGRAGWGYYLEPAPSSSEAQSSAGEDSEATEGSIAVEDVADVHHERAGRRRRRQTRGERDTSASAGRCECGRRQRHVADARDRNAGNGYPVSALVESLTESHGRRIARAIAERARMAVKSYTLISLWFLITIPVIFWDAGYCFYRPRSMVGGDLHWIWSPYALYQDIDYVYGLKAIEENSGFTNAQSALNVIENFMNIGYLYLTHVSGSPFAPLLGFASATMTLSKTVLYWLQEYYCGGCAVGHNDFKTLFVYWIIPNGAWLVVPTYIIWRLGSDINSALQIANRATAKTKKQ